MYVYVCMCVCVYVCVYIVGKRRSKRDRGDCLIFKGTVFVLCISNIIYLLRLNKWYIMDIKEEEEEREYERRHSEIL